jgi:hypothetical protein
MSHKKEYLVNRKSLGDAAVDGLYGGITAGVAMVIYLVLVGLLQGHAPGTMLSRFDPSDSGSALTGTLAHLAVAGVYGTIFGLLWHFLMSRRPTLQTYGWLIGLLYGLSLWLLAESLTMRGPGSALLTIPLLHFALAHAVYGLVLGFLAYRQQRGSN